MNIFKRLAWKVSGQTQKGDSIRAAKDCIVADDISNSSSGMRFTIYNANGGKVVQFSQYDSVKDRNRSSLYIVGDKDDLGQELSQIILKEQLSR